MGKLRIGMVGSNFIRIPPTPQERYIPPGASGAPEIVIHAITEELVKRGFDVTLFASGDSETSAQLVSVTPEATWSTIGKGPHLEYERLLISRAYQLAHQKKLDIIHTHFDLQTAYLAPLIKTPTVQTLHSPLEGIIKEILRHYKNTQYYVSISNYQRQAMPDLQYVTTAYNGLRTESLPFTTSKEDYLVHIGRIIPEKGQAEAIAIAKHTNHRLLLFGSIIENSKYWPEKVQPFVDGEQIVYKGMISRDKLFNSISKARALICPIQWDEPFGLAIIEAMACGTPVVAYARGAIPEIIEDGKTGFVVNPSEGDRRGKWIIDKTGEEGMQEAIERIYSLSPEHYQAMATACREHVKENFSIEKMVDSYEKAYYAILGK